MKDGDFAEIDYVGTVAATGEVFDITDEKAAKEMGVYNPKARYGPALVVIGAGMAVPGVENVLRKMKPGEEREFDVEPKDAFGPRVPAKIRIISYQKFISNKINPVPGDVVEIDGKQARIQSVSGGRVRVDFNHPLAGKRLHYRLRLVRMIKEPLEKARKLLEYYGIEAECSLKEGKLSVKAKGNTHEVIRKAIDEVIRKRIPEIKSVEFQPSGEKKEVKTNA